MGAFVKFNKVVADDEYRIAMMPLLPGGGGKEIKPETPLVKSRISNSTLLYIPEIKITSGIETFYECYRIRAISDIDATGVESFERTFWYCRSLILISKLKINRILTSQMNSNMFHECRNLEKIIIEGSIKVDKSINLFVDSLWPYSMPKKLTVDSMMSFINAFEDNTGEETQYTFGFGSENLARLTPEQIAVATNKNILLA